VQCEFGVFDHLDRGTRPIADVYRSRLAAVEAYDRGAFYAYHLAEHHGTSLGLAPCPGVFLSAVAQRTQRLRFGPMLYVLPLHDPLRLLEEIAMLDQLSGGRLELGMGRGFSPFELAYFGVSHLESRRIYLEAMDVILAGLRSDVLNHEGRYFQYYDVPMVLTTIQQPHPPLWQGVTNPRSAELAARNGINVIMNGPDAAVRPLVDAYRRIQNEIGVGRDAQPKLGLTRHIHVADTDQEAEQAARAAYATWYRSNAELWRRFQTESLIFPRTYDEAVTIGTAIVGSPESVRRGIENSLSRSGANYLVGRFAFGDLADDVLLRCIDLFAAEVMPRFCGSDSLRK
jgi:alkanesulfonate monooxygenase SsuD/methylene tetrahydromethanopterin reductase-like flavin-dependent oxidoreductase (luciferase family)